MSAATPKKKDRNDRGQNIQVFVRVRPLSASEKAARSYSVVDSNTKEVVIKEKASSSLTKTFNFDRVFGVNSEQQDVHKHVVGPLISQVLQGYNCTVFAYGQTGTGKTYTMEGLGEDKTMWDNDPEAGIIPRSLSDIFDGLRMSKASDFAVRVSFLELYNEEIFDLLSGEHDTTRLRLYEDSNKKGSVIIQGLEELQVHSKAEVYKILEKGSIKRRTAATLMNANSSRSHTVFTVTVLINQTNMGEEEMIKIGKLNLVDLAGSENIGRSGAVEKRAREAGNINQSLLTLGRVITSLVDRTPHIPYRESKLTRLLQDSLGGRTKTSIIATVSPAGVNLEETLSTLDYAHRAKNITNKPEINQKISKKAKLLEYTEEIDRLKSELQAAREKDGVFLPQATYEELVKKEETQDQEITSMVEKIKFLEEECEKVKEMFQQTEHRLEETVKERDDTLKTLSCTRSVLAKTTDEKEEQEYLVSKHIETECKLSQQANRLLTVSDESTKELEKVHDKLDRKRIVENENEKVSSNFQSNFRTKYTRMEDLLKSHVSAQGQFCTEMRDSIETSLEGRNNEKVQISDVLTRVMENVVKVISNIENAVSDNMYAEQTWVNSQMKSSRNTADTQLKNLQAFLTDKILPQLGSITATIRDHKSSVQETSSQIDTLMRDQNLKCKKFVEDQDALASGLLKSVQEVSKIRENNLHQVLENEKSVKSANVNLGKDFEEVVSVVKAFSEKLQVYSTKSNNTFLESENIIGKVVQSGKKLDSTVKSHVETSIKDGKSFLYEQSQEALKIDQKKKYLMESLDKNFQIISSAGEALSTDSKEFVSKSQDAWEKQYSDFEGDLRQKSDKSSDQLKFLQEKTQTVRTIMLDSQKAMETRLESHSTKDSRASRELQKDLEGQCKDIKGFGKSFEDELEEIDHSVNNFFTRDLRHDIPTGQTPSRGPTRTYPQEIIQGTPDNLRLERHRRNRRDLSSIVTVTLENGEKEDDDDFDSVISTNTMASEDLIDNGLVGKSREKILSRQNSRGSSASSRRGSITNLNRMSPSRNDFEDDVSDRENKGRNFVKPKKNSQLKRPEIYATRSRSGSNTGLSSRSRSNSRTRSVLGSVN